MVAMVETSVLMESLLEGMVAMAVQLTDIVVPMAVQEALP
jgi:hypothetical protein